MAYMVIDECMACGMCERACPNGAISEGDMISVIDPNRCTECVGANPSPLCTQECPADAIQLDPAHAENKQELLAKWQSLHPGETPRLF